MRKESIPHITFKIDGVYQNLYLFDYKNTVTYSYNLSSAYLHKRKGYKRRDFNTLSESEWRRMLSAIRSLYGSLGDLSEVVEEYMKFLFYDFGEW